MRQEILIDRIEAAREEINAAQRLAVLTGAGISAESGVPTYRGVGGGLWDGLKVEDWATPEGWARDAQRVWKWYSDRRVQLKKIHPNPGHQALAELQKRLAEDGRTLSLATQNIDNLHQQAGNTD